MTSYQKKDAPLGLEGIAGSRMKRWGELGVERVKADLLAHDGVKLIGGSRELRDQAWRWVRYEEARAALETGKSQAGKKLKPRGLLSWLRRR